MLERFRNPAIRHRTWQIAMDGSQKLPQRLLGTLRWRLERNLSSPALILGISGWMRYASGQDEKGQPIDVRDPLAARFARISSHAEGDATKLAADSWVLKRCLHRSFRARRFAHRFRGELNGLLSRGARQTLAHFLNQPPNAGPVSNGPNHKGGAS